MALLVVGGATFDTLLAFLARNGDFGIRRSLQRGWVTGHTGDTTIHARRAHTLESVRSSIAIQQSNEDITFAQGLCASSSQVRLGSIATCDPRVQHHAPPMLAVLNAGKTHPRYAIPTFTASLSPCNLIPYSPPTPPALDAAQAPSSCTPPDRDPTTAPPPHSTATNYTDGQHPSPA